MKTITYRPSRDELVAGTCRSNRGRTRDYGPFTLCWDRNCTIRGIAVRQATRQLQEFQKDIRVVMLGGVMRHVRISEDDIRESRRELLGHIEAGW